MPSPKTIGITKIKKAVRDNILNPREHPALKVVAEMNDPSYCRKRAMEELSLPLKARDDKVAFTLLAMARAMEDADA
jgi:hypothetical protein